MGDTGKGKVKRTRKEGEKKQILEVSSKEVKMFLFIILEAESGRPPFMEGTESSQREDVYLIYIS